MAEFYKVIIIEMPRIEWDEIVEGVREVHPELKDFSDEQIEQFLKESTYGYWQHTYVCFKEEAHGENK